MGLYWFHLFCPPGNTEDKTPHSLVEPSLRSHMKVSRTLYHNCSSHGGRGMKNASFSYLVSLEIMDINPMPRWRGCFFFFFYFLPSPQLLGSHLWLGSEFHLFGRRCRLGGCSHISWLYLLWVFSTHHFPTASTHHCKANKSQDESLGSVAFWLHSEFSRRGLASHHTSLTACCLLHSSLAFANLVLHQHSHGDGLWQVSKCRFISILWPWLMMWVRGCSGDGWSLCCCWCEV